MKDAFETLKSNVIQRTYSHHTLGDPILLKKTYILIYQRYDDIMSLNLGEFTPFYILHTRAFGTYLLGGGYLPCK